MQTKTKLLIGVAVVVLTVAALSLGNGSLFTGKLAPKKFGAAPKQQVVQPNLKVSLAEGSAPAGQIVRATSDVDAATFSFIAEKENVVVNKLGLRVIGTIAPMHLKNLRLFETTATGPVQVGPVVAAPVGGVFTVQLDRNFKVYTDHASTLKVKVDLVDDAPADKTFGISIANAQSVNGVGSVGRGAAQIGGNFPINGNLMTTIEMPAEEENDEDEVPVIPPADDSLVQPGLNAATPGTITLGRNAAFVAQRPAAGAIDVRLFSFTIAAAGEDVEIQRISFSLRGAALSGVIKLGVLENNELQVLYSYPNWEANNGQLSTYYTVRDGETKEFYVTSSLFNYLFGGEQITFRLQGVSGLGLRSGEAISASNDLAALEFPPVIVAMPQLAQPQAEDSVMIELTTEPASESALHDYIFGNLVYFRDESENKEFWATVKSGIAAGGSFENLVLEGGGYNTVDTWRGPYGTAGSTQMGAGTIAALGPGAPGVDMITRITNARNITLRDARELTVGDVAFLNDDSIDVTYPFIVVDPIWDNNLTNNNGSGSFAGYGFYESGDDSYGSMVIDAEDTIAELPRLSSERVAEAPAAFDYNPGDVIFVFGYRDSSTIGVLKHRFYMVQSGVARGGSLVGAQLAPGLVIDEGDIITKVSSDPVLFPRARLLWR